MLNTNVSSFMSKLQQLQHMVSVEFHQALSFASERFCITGFMAFAKRKTFRGEWSASCLRIDKLEDNTIRHRRRLRIRKCSETLCSSLCALSLSRLQEQLQLLPGVSSVHMGQSRPGGLRGGSVSVSLTVGLLCCGLGRVQGLFSHDSNTLHKYSASFSL